MSIQSAKITDFDIVKEITHATIKAVYPHYYPAGTVTFFLNHHSDKNISDDIAKGIVFICRGEDGSAVGTVTVAENEINRLFVLPGHQGKGYGKELIEFAEKEIAKNYGEIILHASLSAKAIYLKRGYKEIEYRIINTENGDFLCVDIMKKEI